MSMTKGNGFDLFTLLTREWMTRSCPPEFALTVVKALEVLKPNYEAIFNAGRVPQAFASYEAERIALCKRHAKQDEKGEPTTVHRNGTMEFVIEDREVFDAEVKELQEKNKDAIDAKASLEMEVGHMRDEPINIRLPQITASKFPASVTVQEMLLLRWLCEGESTVYKTGTIRRMSKVDESKC